jgi:hypothetical protein
MYTLAPVCSPTPVARIMFFNVRCLIKQNSLNFQAFKRVSLARSMLLCKKHAKKRAAVAAANKPTA